MRTVLEMLKSPYDPVRVLDARPSNTSVLSPPTTSDDDKHVTAGNTEHPSDSDMSSCHSYFSKPPLSSLGVVVT